LPGTLSLCCSENEYLLDPEVDYLDYPSYNPGIKSIGKSKPIKG
jgi:hypothetical protein